MPKSGETSELQELSTQELYEIAAETGPEYREIAYEALTTDIQSLSAEALGQGLNNIIWSSDYFTSEPESNFWSEFKREFYRVFCAPDEQYQKLRKRIAGATKKSELAVISTIAAAVSSAAGLPAGALVPFCAIGLIVVLRVGREAFCRSMAQEYDPPPSRDPPPKRGRRKFG